MEKEKLYKVLDSDGNSCNGGSYKWSLPKDSKPGAWSEPIKDLKPCENGYHLCRRQDLIHWLGATIYEAEYRGKRVDEDNKIVVGQVRLTRKIENWDNKTKSLFAADCAAWALPFFEKAYPNDKRPRQAIQAARDYANGKITEEELKIASSAASAASGAAYAAYEASSAARAASSAARAASSAAYDEASSAARAAYSEASSAARAAYDEASSAARAASSAARAAYDEAYSEASEHLTKILFKYLK